MTPPNNGQASTSFVPPCLLPFTAQRRDDYPLTVVPDASRLRFLDGDYHGGYDGHAGQQVRLQLFETNVAAELTLPMMQDLMWAGLANINERQTRAVMGSG